MEIEIYAASGPHSPLMTSSAPGYPPDVFMVASAAAPWTVIPPGTEEK